MTKDKSYSDKLVIANQKVKEKAYWLNKLGGEWEKSYFPYDHETGAPGEDDIQRLPIELPEKLATLLEKLSTGSDVKLHIILVAGLLALVQRYTGNEDIVVGTPIYKQEVEGELINTVLTLRNGVTDGMAFKELLLQTRKTIVEAGEHYRYPIEVLAEQLNMPVSEDGGFPLFDIVLLYKNIQDEAYLRDIRWSLNFLFSKKSGKLTAELLYRASRYREETVRPLGDYFTRLFLGVLSDADAPLGSAEMLSPDEKERLLKTFNDTDVEYPGEKVFTRLFEEQVERTPDTVAVVYKDEALTYRGLNEWANRLGRVLAKRGVDQHSIIGIMMDHSLEMMVGVMGILKSGAAYLPIEPKLPTMRVRTMLTDAGAAMLLSRNDVIKDHSFALLQDLRLSSAPLCRTTPRGIIKDLDILPIPDRSLVDYEKYSPYISMTYGKNSIAMQATRGCPYHCLYCHKIWPKSHFFPFGGTYL